MKKKFIIPLLMLGLSIAACQKPDDGPESETQTPESGTQTPEGGSQNPEGGETTPTYTIDIPSSEDTSPVLGTEGGSVDLNFSTSAEWTANVINTRADSWIDVSPKSGSTGASKITITVAQNDTYDERSATVQIKCGSAEKNIVVTQKQKDALTVTKSRFDIPAEGGEIMIEVKSNLSFDYNIDADGINWITEVKTKALSTSTLLFEVNENEDVEKREATIIISSGDINETINIYQEGAEPTLVVSQNEYTIKAEGETIQVEVNSNVNVNVMIQEGVDWVKEVKTKAMSTNSYYFTIEANQSFEIRKAIITFESGKDDKKEYVEIIQEGEELVTVHVSVKGGLESALSDRNLNSIKNLKIIGVLNDVDFLFIREKLNLLILDISEVEITALPGGAFRQTKNVKSLILPNILTEIVPGMFGSSSLISIEIPASVETIGAQAFSSCSNLATVIFEKGSKLKNIGDVSDKTESYIDGAFYNCRSLTSIEIPASVETIAASTFYGCSKLTTVTFEKGSKLKNIGGRYENLYTFGVFYNCKSLTSIEIPASVETIEDLAFTGCSNLTTVTFEKGSKLKNIGDGKRYNSGAFSNCTSLTSIEIPASVETIYSNAFKGCSNLVTVTFEKESNLKIIGGNNDKDDKDMGAFSNCTSLTSIEIPASVETIKAAAFYGCSNLTTVSFEKGSNLKIIGGFYYDRYNHYGAFSDCTSLTSIEIPASVETIDAAAFYNCSNLVTVTFEKESNLNTINNYSFYTIDSKLSTVDMSECAHVEYIGDYSFIGRTISLFKIGTKIPPTASQSSIYTASFSILKVPSGYEEAYRNTITWGRFFSSISALDE